MCKGEKRIITQSVELKRVINMYRAQEDGHQQVQSAAGGSPTSVELRRVINIGGALEEGHQYVQNSGGGSPTSAELRRDINMCRVHRRVTVPTSVE
jgi:hypothetical protein